MDVLLQEHLWAVLTIRANVENTHKNIFMKIDRYIYIYTCMLLGIGILTVCEWQKKTVQKIFDGFTFVHLALDIHDLLMLFLSTGRVHFLVKSRKLSWLVGTSQAKPALVRVFKKKWCEKQSIWPWKSFLYPMKFIFQTKPYSESDTYCDVFSCETIRFF